VAARSSILLRRARKNPSCVPPQVFDIGATLWDRQSGHVTQLPSLSGDVTAAAIAVNDRGDVVGVSGPTCGRPHFSSRRTRYYGRNMAHRLALRRSVAHGTMPGPPSTTAATSPAFQILPAIPRCMQCCGRRATPRIIRSRSQCRVSCHKRQHNAHFRYSSRFCANSKHWMRSAVDLARDRGGGGRIQHG
jgi:hypothetical protein